jgi:hypothetical protein
MHESSWLKNMKERGNLEDLRELWENSIEKEMNVGRKMKNIAQYNCLVKSICRF